MATVYSSEVSVGTYNRIRIKCDYSGTSATLSLQFRRTSATSSTWSDSGAKLKFNGTTKSASYSYSGTVGTSWVTLKSNITGYSISTSGGNYSWSLSKQYGQLSGSGNISIPSQGTAPTGLDVDIVDATWNSVTLNTTVGNWGSGSGAVRDGYLLEVPYVAGVDKYMTTYSGNTTSPVQLTINAETSNYEFSDVPFTVYGCHQYHTGLWANTSVGSSRHQGPTFYTAPYELDSLTYNGCTVVSGGTVTASLIAATNIVHNDTSNHIGFEYRISTDGGSTYGQWIESATTVSAGTNATLDIPSLSQGTEYTVEVRQFCVEALSERFYSTTSTVTFTTDVASKFYGSVNGEAKRVVKLYGSVNGVTKEIKKLYGSVNGETKIVYGGGTTPAPTTEYQMKHYIESINGGYIDTGYKVNQTTSVEIEFCLDSSTAVSGALFGSRVSSGNNDFVIWDDYPTSGGVEYVQVNSNGSEYAAEYSSSARFKWHTVNVATDGKVMIDGRVIGTVSRLNGTHTYNAILLGIISGGTVDSRLYRGKVARCSIYENGVLVKNYLPAVRNSDSEIGFLETVSDTFYTNQGSGTWTTD